MTSLAEKIVARIARSGPITIAEYMAQVLTDPDHGYYMTGDPFGSDGDFTTAPEISQMFGELIGLWCVDTWTRMGAPDAVNLVELGPGRGSLITDALRAAKLAPEFHRALQLHLVEVSPSLRKQQQEKLAAQNPAIPVTWHDSLGQVPDGPLLLIANEFFDALPIRQFEKTDIGWCERLVALAPDGQSLSFILAPAADLAANLFPPEQLQGETGSIVEISPTSAAIMVDIGERIAAQGGAALIIDYGYADPAYVATFQALREHKHHDVLQAPGSADLTAHVDFQALTRAAAYADATVHGPLSQGQFLSALGIAVRAALLMKSASAAQKKDIAAAAARLTDPDQMGDLFKVLAITKPGFGQPAGFE